MRMKRLLLAILALLLAVFLVLLINVGRFPSKQVKAEPASSILIDSSAIAEHLAQAIRFQTVSDETGNVRADQFRALHGYLSSTFPAFHAVASREAVADYSLLYTWKGRDETRPPVLLTAHQDVVPVDSATAERWQQPPFGGTISGGYVWGRGALDDKFGLMGLLEAAELLVRQNFQPARTICFAFGHDEELGGENGAAAVAELLRSRGVRPHYVLDEGLVIVQGAMLPHPLALVGIAEKGFVSVQLKVEAEGGHSSMPPPHTAVGVLSSAIQKLEAHQMPGTLAGVVGQTFEYVGPEMSFPGRLVFANLWLFRPLVERQLAANRGTNAALRTTTAATMIQGGVNDTVLPTKTSAIVNFGIVPGESIERVLTHVRDTIADPHVQISTWGSTSEPSSVAPTNARGFQVIQKTVRQVFPDTVLAPALVLGGTDARHYARLTDQIYRFRPEMSRARDKDAGRLHGIDERVSIDDYAAGVKFYVQLIRNSAP